MGNPLEERSSEERRYFESLSRIIWPRDSKKLWHMKWLDFFAWLHTLNPRDAMIMSNDRHFSQFRERKKNKSQWDHFVSYLWRKIWE